MSDKEAFNIGKWFGGFINPVTWGKSVIYFVMIIALVLGGFTIYRAFFMKTPSNVNKPKGASVITLPGSTTGNITQTTTSTSIQKSSDDRRWEAGVFGGAARLGDEDGFFGGVSLKFKF